MENPETEKTVPDKPSMGTRFIKNKKWLLVGGLLLAIVVTGSVVYVQQNTKDKKPSSVAVDVPELLPSPEFVPPTDEYGKTIYEVDQLIIRSDYDGAIKRLESYIPKTTDPAQIYPIAARLGNHYSSKGDLKKAIEWHEKAEQTGQKGSENQAVYIAVAAEKLGDRPKAITAYKRVLELVKRSSVPSAQADAQKYEAKIKALGG